MNALLTSSAHVLLAVLLLTAVTGAQDQTRPTMDLDRAAVQGNVEQVRLHIAKGTDLEKLNRRNMTPLAVAAQRGNLEVVKLLAEAGANVNAKCPSGPPLYQATMMSHKETLAYLLEKGAKPDGADQNGRTPLMIAAETGQIELVELLVAKGADVNATDSRGRTPLSIANRAHNDDIADIIRQKGGTEPAAAADPYGRDALSSYRSSDSRRSRDDQPDILEDPNAIRARIAAFPPLAAGLKASDANAASEERGWVSQRSDNRTILIRAVAKQFGQEMTLLKKVATREQATKTLTAIDELVAKRMARFDHISSELRDARRLARQESQQAARRGSRGRGSRGRDSRQPAGAYDDPMSTEGTGPYGTGRPERPSRRRTATQPEEPVLDGDTLDQTDAWLRAEDPADKRDLLASVHELDLYELGDLHQIATDEEAKETVAAIEGLMLARQTRLQRITEKMDLEQARLQRLAERTGTMGRRGGRGATTQTETTTPTTPTGRGRRGR